MKYTMKGRLEKPISAVVVSLSAAVLICLCLVFVGCSSTSSPSGLYFLKVDLTDFPTIHSLGTRDAFDAFDARDFLAGHFGGPAKNSAEIVEIKAGLYEHYSVGLLGYCKSGGRGDAVCSHPRASFAFDLSAVLDSASAQLGRLLPDLDQKGISGYHGLTRAGTGLYIAAFTTTLLAVALGGWNLRFSHGKTLLIILCALSALLITTATISVSVRYGVLAFGIKRVLGEVGIRASLGGQLLAVAWLAVLFSFAALLIWAILLF
ncbi:hypothetical protein N7540_011168 [Penicillium herquei]|nr:hypothetical protein N7540_011168 [Penicillium herquei]